MICRKNLFGLEDKIRKYIHILPLVEWDDIWLLKHLLIAVLPGRAMELQDRKVGASTMNTFRMFWIV